MKLKLYFIALFILLCIDACWLGLVAETPTLPAAGWFYLLAVGALVLFIVGSITGGGEMRIVSLRGAFFELVTLRGWFLSMSSLSVWLGRRLGETGGIALTGCRRAVHHEKKTV